MKTIHVSASRSYDILIERGILTRAGEEIKKVCGAGEALIVSEDTVWPLYGETLEKGAPGLVGRTRAVGCNASCRRSRK